MISKDTSRRYSIQLSFEDIRLPPFEDILILGKKCPQGKVGVCKSFEFLIPNEFEAFEVDNDTVEAVFINKRVLKKIDKDKVMNVLRDKVFPFVSENEILKVDFKLKVYYESIEGEL
ncbi:hypothetical protein [Alkaliflexus imshenetskii]|uniref:hypothetical protein n=1 Tax=Alkaliflexus imshenetskii TaxID=286730 RepID=UPI0005C74E2D|nr:hypothetical protein [Alkaliflexus imshenetskii]